MVIRKSMLGHMKKGYVALWVCSMKNVHDCPLERGYVGGQNWIKCCPLIQTSNIVPHCKYIRPDYDGTLAIHSSTYYARST